MHKMALAVVEDRLAVAVANAIRARAPAPITAVAHELLHGPPADHGAESYAEQHAGRLQAAIEEALAAVDPQASAEEAVAEVAHALLELDGRRDEAAAEVAAGALAADLNRAEAALAKRRLEVSRLKGVESQYIYLRQLIEAAPTTAEVRRAFKLGQPASAMLA